MKTFSRLFFLTLVLVFTFPLIGIAQAKVKKKNKSTKAKPVPVRAVGDFRISPEPMDSEPSSYPTPKPTPKPTPRPNVIKSGVVNERLIINYKINSDATFTSEYEMLRRYDAEPQAFDTLLKPEFLFNSALESVSVNEAWVLKSDGNKIVIGQDKIKIQPTAETEAAPEFSSYKILKIEFPKLSKGDRIYLKTTTNHFKTTFSGVFDALLSVNPFEGIDLFEVNIQAPEAMKLLFQTNGISGGKTNLSDGIQNYKWKLEKVIPRDYEMASQFYLNFAPMFLATNVESFENAGEIYQREIAGKVKVTPEIQKLADEITKDKESDEEKANAIYNWTNKNIRYLNLVLDRGGWIPHDATKILENRFGDCKDYTILLQSLLKAKNIASEPVVVRVDRLDGFTSIPAFYFFNHMILYVPSLGKFADATIPDSRLGDMTPLLNEKKGLVLASKGFLIDLPKLNERQNFTASASVVRILPNGDAVSKTTFENYTNPRFLGLETLNAKTKEGYAFSMKLAFARFEIDGSSELLNFSKSTKPDQPNKIEAEATIKRSIEFEKIGSFVIPPFANFGNWKTFETLSEIEKRTTPISFGKIETSDTYEIRFPDGMTIDSIPANAAFENDAGKISVEFKLENNVVYSKREFLIKRKVFQPNEYVGFRELMLQSVKLVKLPIKYTLSDSFDMSGVAKVKKDNKKSADEMMMDILLGGTLGNEKPITAKDLPILEAKLKNNPADKVIRKQLIEYYSDYDENQEFRTKLIGHLMWFIENQPADSDRIIHRSSYFVSEDKEYQQLLDTWLKKLSESPKDENIRLSVVGFVESKNPDLAEKLLLEGEKLKPESYEIQQGIFNLLKKRYDKIPFKEKALKSSSDLGERVFHHGEKAWILAKGERDSSADNSRGDILKELGMHSFKIGKLDSARKMAMELVLEFSKDPINAHIGNTILGLLALRDNDFLNGKKYFDISLKVLIRAEEKFVPPNFELAKELFSRGEKTTVTEFLTKCIDIDYFTRSYHEEELAKLKLWIAQIKKGKTPTFDLESK